MTLLSLVLAILPIAISGFFSLNQTINQIEAMEFEKLEHFAVVVAEQLSSFMNNMRQIATLVSHYDDVVAFIENPSVERRTAVEEELRRIQQIEPPVALILILNQAGIVIAASDTTYLGQNYAFREYFQAATHNQVYISDMTIGARTGISGVFFSRIIPVHNEYGVLVLKVASDEIIKMMRHAGSAQYDPFIINGLGVIIYHPDPRLRYHSLMPLSLQIKQHLKNTQQFLDTEIHSLNLPDLAKTLIRATKSGHISYHIPWSGDDKIMGFAPIHNDDWVVGVAQKRAIFEAPIRQIFYQAWYPVVAIGIFAVIGATLLANGITRPLQRLTSLISQYHDGQLTQQASQGLHSLVRHQPNEISQLARTFLSIQEQLTAYLREMTIVTAQRQRIASELAIAREIQLGLLHGIDLPINKRCWTVNPFILPAYEVGGDLYDCFENSSGQVYLLVGDVSGKGVPAALFMAIVRTLIRATALMGGSPAEILGKVNNELARDNDAAMFVTLFLGLFDPQPGLLHFANAGHLLPYWLRQDGVYPLLAARGGRALGVDQDVPLATGTIALVPGDALFIHTDGVTEATNATGQFFGETRLTQVLQQLYNLPDDQRIPSLMTAIKSFIGEAPQADDLCVLIFTHRLT